MLPVATKEERLELEAALIGLLARHPMGSPSPEWLGHWAADPRIGQSGLWNTQHIDATAPEQGAVCSSCDICGDEGRTAVNEATVTSIRLRSSRLVVIPCGLGKIWDAHPNAGSTASQDGLHRRTLQGKLSLCRDLCRPPGYPHRQVWFHQIRTSSSRPLQRHFQAQGDAPSMLRIP